MSGLRGAWVRLGMATIVASSVFAACGGPSDRSPTTPPPADATDVVPPEALYKAGIGFARQGDHIRASEYITAAMKHGFSPKIAVPSLVQIYVKASRLRDAIAVAERQVGNDPADWRLRLVLATLYLAVRDVPAAKSHAQKVVATAPYSPHGHYLLAVIQRDDDQDVAAASVSFTRYLELAPTGPHAPEARAFLASPTIVAPVENASAPTQVTVPPVLPLFAPPPVGIGETVQGATP